MSRSIILVVAQKVCVLGGEGGGWGWESQGIRIYFRIVSDSI